MLLENNEAGGLNYKETELTLGLPGKSRQKKGAKRGYSETTNLSFGGSIHDESRELLQNEFVSHVVAQSANSKNIQVVGWPPVMRSFKQNIVNKPKKFVKVAVDGAPFLRKVGLENYNSYQHLLCALGEMFTCFTICNGLVIDPVNGFEYVTTYEDKDGDWMLVGDVPWKMFVESCKRVRLMKSSEAIGLASKTPTNCSSSSTR